MADFRERRGTPRLPITAYVGAWARATLEVRLVDLSVKGARIEHADLLRPGSECAFQFPPAIAPLVLTARVVHSTVVDTTQNADGERRLRYQSGLQFVGVSPDQRSMLEGVVERLTPGGGVEVRLHF
ncbi:MAG TPA: PilZ domain-containing protein [Candidatus Methylomirabilis sp.]|nr:PilZ domain-containing protein [Candidatus Methylomirabilis sp.]